MSKGYKIPKELIIYEIPISPYPDKVLVANKRRTYYKKWNKNRPKKYKNFGKDKDGWLIDNEGNKVVKNTRTAGQPRFYNLRGQDLWSFNIHPALKSKVSESLKKLYYENFRGVVDYGVLEGRYLGIEIEFKSPLKEDKNGDLMIEDLDNMERWHKKCVLDALSGNVEFERVDSTNKRGFELKPDRVMYPPIIKDDNLQIIRELPVKFTETEDMKEIVIRIYEVK